jgi:hypothetical protein
MQRSRVQVISEKTFGAGHAKLNFYAACSPAKDRQEEIQTVIPAYYTARLYLGESDKAARSSR